MKRIIYMGLITIILYGCAAPYHGSPIPHIYTTDTQQQHIISGIQVNLQGDLLQSAVMAAMLTATTRTMFIDGREVYSTTAGKGLRIFMQLPPGEHEIIYEAKLRGGAVIIGMPWGTWREQCTFILTEHSKANLVIALGSTKPRMDFNHVKNLDCNLLEKTGFFSG